MLPNLLIIGAGKCGTTSLHQYLGLHPQIEMSWPKELQFFTRARWRDEVDWYAAQFSDSPAIWVRGEASPAYTMYPRLPSAAERIHALLPDAKLIYVVGDPVARAIAHYVEWRALGFERRTIDEALGGVQSDRNPFLCASRYASQLNPYLRLFAPDQILVLDQVDLRERRAQTLASTFGFLGVDAAFHSPEYERVHNVRMEKVRYNRLGRWLMKRQLFTVRREAFRRGPLVEPLRRLLSRPIDDVPSAAVSQQLAEDLTPEVARLRELTGQPFDRWDSIRRLERPSSTAAAPAGDC